jgi:Tfp pilus assembly protein PilV
MMLLKGFMSVFHGRSLSRGLTLMEALIAMILMGAVVVGLLGVIPYGYNEIQVNATQVQAIALGQQYLDALRNDLQTSQPLPTATTAPVDQGDSFMFMNGSANPASGSFNVTPNTCPLVSGAFNQFDCVVTVTWTQNGKNESVKVESYVTH